MNTDCGRVYIKPMGNRQGPHVLATDWLGIEMLHLSTRSTGLNPNSLQFETTETELAG